MGTRIANLVYAGGDRPSGLTVEAGGQAPDAAVGPACGRAAPAAGSPPPVRPGSFPRAPAVSPPAWMPGQAPAARTPFERGRHIQDSCTDPAPFRLEAARRTARIRCIRTRTPPPRTSGGLITVRVCPSALSIASPRPPSSPNAAMSRTYPRVDLSPHAPRLSISRCRTPDYSYRGDKPRARDRTSAKPARPIPYGRRLADRTCRCSARPMT
jgi:hypothetical protein